MVLNEPVGMVLVLGVKCILNNGLELISYFVRWYVAIVCDLDTSLEHYYATFRVMKEMKLF